MAGFQKYEEKTVNQTAMEPINIIRRGSKIPKLKKNTARNDVKVFLKTQ
jgi:hypothetical protein